MTKKTSFFTGLLAVVLSLTLVACSNTTPAPSAQSSSTSVGSSTAAESSSNASAIEATAGSFVIKTTTGDITVNVSDIAALPPISMEVAKKTSNGDSMMTITGGDFDALLQQHDLSQKELETIRLEAADGYSIEITKDMLTSRQIILAYTVDGKPLTPEEAPIWVVIPEERAMYWAKNISTIHLNGATQQQNSAQKVVILETAATALTQTNIDGEKAVSGQDLLKVMGHSTTPEAFAVVAADGLEKNETTEVLNKASILVTGADAPKITGAEIPKGMQIKNALSFSAEGTTLVSINSCTLKSGKTEADGKSGVAISEVLKSAGMVDAATYVFAAADGYEKEIAASDIASGIIYVNEEGKLTTFFNGLPKNTSVKDLLSITAK